jgi:hypothetical protein
MRTAEEMYEYCVANGFGKGFNKKNSIKHFSLIQDTLFPDEDVLCVFIGLHNYISTTKHDNNFAYAITNKRIIMGQKKVIGQNVQIILLDNVNDITYSTGILMGIITIDTIKETFNVAIAKDVAKNIYNSVHETFYNIKNTSQNNTSDTKTSPSPIQQIKELKELLDMGIITQEEFDLKKKQLLEL